MLYRVLPCQADYADGHDRHMPHIEYLVKPGICCQATIMLSYLIHGKNVFTCFEVYY